MDSSSSSSPLVEQLGPGVTLERLAEGQIFVFTLSDVSRPTIDTWVAAVKNVTAGWPRHRPYFALNHFAGKNVSLSPYLRAAIKDLATYRPAQSGFIAAVLPRTFFAQLMTLLLPAMNRGNMISRIFFSREEALAWLEKALEKELSITPR
jgi:hypothetical protein